MRVRVRPSGLAPAAAGNVPSSAVSDSLGMASSDVPGVRGRVKVYLG